MSDWFEGGASRGLVNVPELMDDLVIGGIQQLVADGALVSLGLTSDGGAVGFTVTVDGRWRRDYFRHAEELVAFIAEALPAVKLAREGHAQPSPAPRQRQRGRTKP
jgi:hypothetical protein